MTIALDILSHSPQETRRIGRVLGKSARPTDVFLLVGPLGAGKTCLTQGIAWGLEVQGYVRSPTFVLIGRYQGRLPVHHIDLFRIDDPLEAYDLGLEEYLNGQGVCIVEWADRATELFSTESLWVEMEYGDSARMRRIRVVAQTDRYLPLLEGLKTLKIKRS